MMKAKSKKTSLFSITIFICFIIFMFFNNKVEGNTMEVKTLAEQLFFVTIRIEIEKIDKNGKIEKGIGTSFIVEHEWNNKKGLFLVTNKHVIKDAKKGHFFFFQSSDNKPVLGKVYNIHFDNFEKRWFGHPNKDIDVAVMPLADILEKVNQKKWKVFYKIIHKKLLPTDETEKKLDAIERILFIGYPSGIYDKVNYLPIIRTGITATPLTIDYLGAPQFLVDASVFPGSSGSPVFILNEGSYSPKGGGLVLGNRIIFLGLISSVYTRHEKGILEFVDVQTTLTPIIKVPQMLDLGLVVKSHTVFEAIDALLKSKGEIK